MIHIKKEYISVYVRNKEFTPSSYYRIMQYIPNLENQFVINELVPNGVYKRYLDNKKSKNRLFKLFLAGAYFLVAYLRFLVFSIRDCRKKPKCIIVSKTFFPRFNALGVNYLIKKMAKNSKIIWDFDDHILNGGEISANQYHLLERLSDKIVVTNQFLKTTLSADAQKKTKVLATTDGFFSMENQELMIKNRLSTLESEVRLVWVATSGNLPNLLEIIPELEKAAKKIYDKTNKRLKLIVVCNSFLSVSYENLEVENIIWTREGAKEEIKNAHIGIMPLQDTSYNRGKGGFKLVQYMASSLPLIASNVGFNKEIIKGYEGILVDDKQADDWLKAIATITKSNQDFEKYSHTSYKTWKNNFSYEKNLLVWQELLDE